ncbi:MAG TPA: ribonuclease D [Gammaproteobacteria bacterium]|nr:ribonuclease D [Gammaproteobacteria bacterium]
MNTRTLWIDHQEALDAWVIHAKSASWLGVDTEFERVRTFFPRLCLLQMATSEQAVCIDPLAELDWDGVRALISEPQPVKIFHAARQDLEVLQQHFSVVPGAFFDTQIAAAFCGYGEQVGYARMVKEICDVTLSKAFTRTPWCRRPLSEAEVQYALDDVHYLGTLYHTLLAGLQDRGRETWLTEDCAALICEESLRKAEHAPIEKVMRACAGMDRVSQSVALSLARWREDLARGVDRPREWLISTDTLIELAQTRPQNTQALSAVMGLEKGTLKRRGEEILDVIRESETPDSDFVAMSRPTRPDPAEKALGNALWKYLGEVCEREGVPPSAIAPRNEIRALAAGKRNLRVLSGWRRSFIGELLLERVDPAGSSSP